MQDLARSPLFPRHMWALLGLYFVASLTHFAHNAEYIAFYPNMPHRLTRENVYFAWWAITLVGAVGIVLTRIGWRFTGAACVAAYGALGLDGLGHYALALCSEHTLAMNLTIGFEAVAGTALAAAAVVVCVSILKAYRDGRLSHLAASAGGA